MRNQTLQRGAIVAATTLGILAAFSGSAIASGAAGASKRARPLKVSCDQLYAEIDKSAAQLEQQYNAMGFTIGLPSPLVPDPFDPSEPPTGGDTVDGILHGGGCQKQGKRVRLGVGFMNDVHSPGEPPFPGEANPAIREYNWTWREMVTRTKSRALRDAVLDLKCDKSTYDGSPQDPHNIQTFPC
jgi:hypothetical protein